MFNVAERERIEISSILSGENKLRKSREQARRTQERGGGECPLCAIPSAGSGVYVSLRISTSSLFPIPSQAECYPAKQRVIVTSRI